MLMSIRNATLVSRILGWFIVYNYFNVNHGKANLLLPSYWF